MALTLLPALDLAAGVVAVSAADPIEEALALQAAGAEWLHVVDLDAAFGRGSNLELMAAVVHAVDLHVEVAGGIVDAISLDAALSTGCARVSLSTAALADRSWCAAVLSVHGDRLAFSLDARLADGPVGSASHRLAARGGGVDAGGLWETLAWLESVGCQRCIVTDAGRDGMLSGFDTEFYAAVARATGMAIVASGGASTLDDLTAVCGVSAHSPNLDGVIVGAALHAGRFSLADALAAVAPPRP